MTRNTALVLDNFLPYRLSVLSNVLSQSIAREYDKRFGLSITEWRVMAVLGCTTNISAREVAERTSSKKAWAKCLASSPSGVAYFTGRGELPRIFFL